VNVKEVMTPKVVEMGAQDSCYKAAQLMRDHGVGMVVVTTGPRILEGVITDRDITVRCTALGGDPAARPVGEYMDTHPLSVDGDIELERAVDMMRNAGLRRLPVTEAGSRVIGILSLDDIALDAKHYLDAFLAVASQYAHKAR
jgi:CBS domain-containing protein